MKRVILGCVFFLILSTPLFAWYYFTASNGQRQQWVFGSSCNPYGKPITMIYDSDIQGLAAGYQTAITTVINEWNAPTGGNLLCPTATCSPSNATYQRTMNASTVLNFMANPTANQIWIVWDADGTVFQSIGVDPKTGIYGIGTAASMNTERPQDLCAGLVLINARHIVGGSPVNVFQSVLIHEIGHTLGFAHSIVGSNYYWAPSSVVFAGYSCSGRGCQPAMFPFLDSSGSPITLNADDIAGVRSLYAP